MRATVGETIVSALEWLETTGLAEMVQQEIWLYTALIITHIVGMVLLAGSAWMFDLRLLGRSKHVAISDMASHLLPWARFGFALALVSGFVLFMSGATFYYEMTSFRIKLALIAAALINANAFHLFIFTHHDVPWNKNAPTPITARLIAILSLTLWFSAIISGGVLANM